jgi:hypothetical protein
MPRCCPYQRYRNTASAMRGVNREIDSPRRHQDLFASHEPPRHIGREANNRTISLCDEQDRRTKWAIHMLPAKELVGRNTVDTARPLPKGGLQHFEDAELVLSDEGSDLDRAIELNGTRRHPDGQ